jgi:hypothetical protein
MLAISRRVAVMSLILAVTFLAGMAFDAVSHREAHAQSLATSNIVVPEGGLFFRSPDGTPIARLSRDAHGANFELFDERLATRPTRVASDLRSRAYVDDDDPWEERPAKAGARPGPGF